MRLRLPLLLPLVAFCIIRPQGPAQAQSVKLNPPADPVPSAFFGMHIHEPQTASRLPGIPIRTWRLWDTYAAWPDIEPNRGDFRWQFLDFAVDLAAKNQWQLILPLAFSPRWASARPNAATANYPNSQGWPAEPADIQYWRDYVQAVASRYRGRIHIFEIWNEPNNATYYTGSMPQLVQMAKEAYTIVKAVDPNNTVLSPAAADNGGSGAQWLDRYLTAGGGDYADVIAYHFYIDANPPEKLPARIAAVQAVLTAHKMASKPLWNTEASWAASAITFASPQDAAAYLARGYILNWASGVRLFAWYAWDDRGYPSIYLVGPDLHTPTPAATAYAELEKWLTGARMLSCQQDSTSTWTCDLQSPGGMLSHILWNPDRSVPFTLPPAWRPATLRDLAGNSQAAPGVVTVTSLPVLIEGPAIAQAAGSLRLTSAASYQTNAAAPESLVSLWGTQLAASAASAPYLPAMETLNGTTVAVTDSAGVSRLAPLVYVAPGQINLEIPSGTASGPASINVIAQGGAVSSGTAAIAAVSPGLFSADGSGAGPAAATATTGGAGGSQSMQAVFSCNVTCVADPLDLGAAGSQVVLTLYGTGFRGARLSQVSARFCDTTLPVTFAGPQGTYVGLDQINVQLPPELKGCGLGLLDVAIDQQHANPVQIDVR